MTNPGRLSQDSSGAPPSTFAVVNFGRQLVPEGLRSGVRDIHRHHVRVRYHCGEQGSAARAGLYFLIADVPV
jgi:hypothetical protein